MQQPETHRGEFCSKTADAFQLTKRWVCSSFLAWHALFPGRGPSSFAQAPPILFSHFFLAGSNTGERKVSQGRTLPQSASAWIKPTSTSWTEKSPRTSGQRKTAEWQLEEQQIMMAMQGLEQANPDVLLNAKKILELANKAYFLYLTQNPAEQVRLGCLVFTYCSA
jgi:hypothetical protein